MSFYKIANNLKVGLNKIEENKKLNTSILSNKLNKAAELYPNDLTIVSVARVIDKLAARNNVITINDFKKVASSFYSNYSKFENVFASELGLQEEVEEVKEVKKEVKAFNISDYTNPLLVSLFERTLDSTVKLPTYNNKIAAKAEKYVSSLLEGFNLTSKQVKVACGNSDYLVLQASYETPKGITGVLIPLEVLDDKVSVAGTFIGNNGLNKLNHNELKNYILTNSGAGLNVHATSVLNLLVKSASTQEPVSDVELAVMRLKTKQAAQVPGLYATASLEEVVSEVKAPVSEEYKTFEEQLSSVAGMASFKFGKEKVSEATNLINAKLNILGYKNNQVKVSNISDKSITFAVKTANLAFNTTVKFDKNTINNPNYIVANGNIIEFNKNGLSKLAMSPDNFDVKAAAAASNLNNLTAGELVNEVRVAIEENNLAKAEDSLNVLAHSGNKVAYLNAFDIYTNGLNGKVATANCYSQCRCDNQIKISTSKFPVCAHTNLPINKVYTDQHGYCRPLFRRGQEDSTSEVMQTINHKLFG